MRIPLLCKPALNIAFIQTDLSEAVLYFVGVIIRRRRYSLYSDDLLPLSLLWAPQCLMLNVR
jgi:hypothetical protein